MKKIIRIGSVLAIIVLASCSGDLAGLSLPDFNFGGGFVGSDQPEGFYDNLANEYKNLSSYVEEFRQDSADAEHFAAKARRALRHQGVAPDQPVDRNIPDFSIEELQNARSMLMDALDTLQIPGNEALLAMAQSRYDCWLFSQEGITDPDAWISCKAAFYDALALLDIPQEDLVAHNIYFESGGAAVDEEGRQTVAKVAERYARRAHWDIVLKGYTDSTGSKSENQRLSMRRAIAVKNTLGQFGVDLDNIAISAEGEAVKKGEGDERDSRRVEIRVWPHYAAKNKEGLRQVAGWAHSGEF